MVNIEYKNVTINRLFSQSEHGKINLLYLVINPFPPNVFLPVQKQLGKQP